MREQQLQEIREACIAANPQGMWGEFAGSMRPVRLADVLLALQIAEGVEDTKRYAIGTVSLIEKYDLRKDDLTEQSDETLAFIHSLLCV